jgi:hypothetical protein
MDKRRPVSGGFMQLDAHAPKEMLVALVIHHFDALLGDDSRFRAATRAQRPQKLTRASSMFAGDEAGASVVDVTEKGSGTKIAVCNPEITGLHRVQKRPEQRAFLRMAVFTRHDISDQAWGGLLMSGHIF